MCGHGDGCMDSQPQPVFYSACALPFLTPSSSGTCDCSAPSTMDLLLSWILWMPLPSPVTSVYLESPPVSPSLLPRFCAPRCCFQVPRVSWEPELVRYGPNSLSAFPLPRGLLPFLQLAYLQTVMIEFSFHVFTSSCSCFIR
jgi:hypothetical protein